jgi:hypothetical protein
MLTTVNYYGEIIAIPDGDAPVIEVACDVFHRLADLAVAQAQTSEWADAQVDFLANSARKQDKWREPGDPYFLTRNQLMLLIECVLTHLADLEGVADADDA